VDYALSDARDHDARHFKVTKELRGYGALVDLGYVSHTFLKDCRQHEVSYVIRLKEGWKVKVDGVVTGTAAAAAFDEGPFDFATALANESLQFKDGVLDLNISLRVEGERFPLRLVALEIPGKNVCVFLTNLPRERYAAALVGDLYRLRWEIEKDNKLNKSDRDMDELDGHKKASVHIMLYSALLGSLLVNRVVHHDHRELFATWQDRPRAPFHARLVAMALAAAHSALAEAMATEDSTHPGWRSARAVLEGDGRDPNWRRRPSVLDTLFGFTAPPGRPRRGKTTHLPA
jgi:IS4 transposase